MLSFSKQNNVTITCHKWLSPYLAIEVKELGFSIEEVFQTGVHLKASINDCIKLNLHLRTASQVLYSMKKFHCNHPDELYANVLKIDWQQIIPVDGFFSITSNVFHPTINNNLFANVRVKDAIVDVIKNKTGQRPNSGNDLSKTVIHLHWKNNMTELFIDTSGESLGRHGYRKIPGKAPMLEALAASAILATNWDRKSTFINPMCGSGTLAIEAALMATNRKPGLLRKNYGFMHLIGYNEDVYINELQNLFSIIQENKTGDIIASDISEDAVHIASVNASHADVEDLIRFEKCDFQKTTIPVTKGIVILNPEYGLRLGDETLLEETYQRIGDFFKQQCEVYTGYIFTGNLELAKKIGLKPNKRIEFLNGKIDCRLLEYELYKGSKK